MSHDLMQHAADAGKVTVGAATTAASVYSVFTLADLIQYATLAASLSMSAYYLVMTAIAVAKYLKSKR